MRIFAGTRLCKVCGHPIYAGVSARPGRLLWHAFLALGALWWILMAAMWLFHKLGIQ